MRRVIPENCTFCGLCCTLTVRLDEKEIGRIEKGTGLGREKFVVAEPDGATLKRENGWCTFFRREGKIGVCAIYEHRPENCREFPGRICDLAQNPIYKYASNNEETKRIMQLHKNAPTSKTSKKKIDDAQMLARKIFTT